MERKRKLPARSSRVESASKKRTSTPPEQRVQTPPPAAIPPPVVAESLPKSIVAAKPLPTVDSPQPEDLLSKDYQTISESGVLTESLQRSRQKWISEGIFEKYWTKPVKKKGVLPDLPNNPAKDTMTKLGTCTITIEPHIIDAVMYSIKEPAQKSAPPPPPPPQQQQMYRPIIQYGPPNGMMTPPPPPAPPGQQRPPPPQSSPRPQNTVVRDGRSPSTPNNISGTSLGNGTPSSSQPPYMRSGNSPSNHQPPAPAGKSTDPVIQMLAERAASDPGLKALMRIVANGEATPTELKTFQSHIDDLTQLQRARQAATQGQQQQAMPPHPIPPPTTSSPQVNGNSRPTQGGTPTHTPSRAPPPPPTPQPQYQPQPQALRSKGPVPSAKPDISGVVFEFTGGSGDRFLFPKFSILEYLPQGQVVASFLIVRKGSSSDSPTYDPELDYYQPITIRLYAHQGRQLEALQKVVAPPQEVTRYMDDIMDNMTRAEYVLLAMRLPRDKEQIPAVVEKEKEAEAAKTNQMNDQIIWATTNPTPIAKLPSHPPKQPATEQQSYHTFINSVSSKE